MEHRYMSRREYRGKAKERQKYEGDDSRRDRSGDNTRRREVAARMAFAKPAFSLPALNADNDYVQRWLTQTEEENPPHGDRVIVGKKRHRHEEIDQRAQGDFLPFHHASHDVEDDGFKTRRKRQQRNSSSDSSLLETAVDTKLDPSTRDEANPDRKRKRKGAASQPQRDRGSESSGDGSPVHSSNHRGTFEKRPRHKTRHDRYELKKNKTVVERLREKPSRNKREKKGDKKKASKKAGEDLMRNFSSKSVGQERLTIRPSHGPGLFKNGRIPSPAKRRGLPDLASSEMLFLERFSRVSAAKDEDSITSKSREKEKRRAEMAHNEISTFFQPQRAPLKDIATNVRQETPPECVSDDQPKQKAQRSNHHYAKERMHQQRTESPVNRYSKYVQYPPRPSKHKSVSGTASKGSAETTTCVTWSDTQYSPIAKRIPRRSNSVDRRQTSPTPELIRESIENTGIFRDTGIVSRSTPHRIKDTASPGESAQARKKSASACHISRSYKTSESTTSPSSKFSKSNNLHSESGNESGHPRTLTPRDDVRKEGSTLLGSLEQLDPHSRPRPNNSTAREQHKRSPISREELARKARIKRPPASLPTAKAMEGEHPQYENIADIADRNNTHPRKEASQTDATDAPAENTETSQTPYNQGGRCHEAPAGELVSAAQQVYSLEAQTSPQPGPIPRNGIPECPSRGAFDNSVTCDQNIRGQAHTGEYSPSVLPTRGSWILRGSETVSGPVRLSPIPEYPPPDVKRYQQAYHWQQLNPPQENQMSRYEGLRELVGHETIYHVEDNEADPWGQDYGEAFQQSYNHTDDNFGGGLEELGYYFNGNPIDTELWDREYSTSFQEAGSGGLGHDLEDIQTSPGDVYYNNAFNQPPVEVEGDKCEEAEECLMQGFWRPHRTY